MQNIINKWWTQISIGILVLGALWIWWSATPPGSTTAGAIPAPQEGFLAPDFELVTLEGEMVSLAEMRGKVVLLNFWASWCPPCRKEMPAMQKIFDEYNQEDFVILAVNSTNQDRISDAEAFSIEQGLSFPILLDTDGRVANQYQVRSLPTSFFIDPNGIIREIVIGGPMAEVLLRTRVEKLLEENN